MGMFLLGLLGGVLAGLLLAALEPVHRLIGRLARRTESAVTLHTETDPAVIWAGMPNWIGFHYFLPPGARESEPPQRPHAWRRWALDNGGWDCVESVVRLTMIGQLPVTVVVEAPIVQATRAQPPPGFVAVWPVGGADIVPREIVVHIDHVAVPIMDAHAGPNEPLNFPLSISHNEVEQIILRVRARAPGLYQWTAKLPVIVDGKRRYLDVRNEGGKPFEFVGSDLEDWQLWTGQDWGRPH